MTPILFLHCQDNQQKNHTSSTVFPPAYSLTKVVIWLPVNRLPVKLPVTGFNFQLPVTDLRTFFLHVM